MIPIVVPVSGGKDSELCLQLAIEKVGAANVVPLFCDTQFEHPLTYQHIASFDRIYGVKVQTITAGSVDDKVAKYGRFPTGQARFCTDELKMRPSRDWYRQRAVRTGPFHVWYGMRTSESTQRRKRYAGLLQLEPYAPHELFPEKYPKALQTLGVAFVLPILDWTTAEVFKRLASPPNPLYAQGFDRVGCFPCLAAGPKVMAKAFGHDAFGSTQAQRVIRLSIQTGKDPMSSSGQPCSLCLI